MGLVGKLKNILFEEEEVEIPVLEKKTPVVKEVPKTIYKEMPKKEEVREPIETNNYYNNDLEKITRQEKKVEDYNERNNGVSERELFKSEKTFNFPAFDEEEFQNVVPRSRRTNVMEHEKKKVEKKPEYKPIEKKVKIEEEPPKKFKPSPIISPVYGILDKNYTPEEITTKATIENNRTLDIDNVRKKAFGENVKKEETNMDDKILEEKLEKARTIDELLKDSSDEVITIKDDIDDNNLEYKEDFVSLDNLENNNKTLEESPKEETKENEETIENDLFDLIDSMYENREDGE